MSNSYAIVAGLEGADIEGIAVVPVEGAPIEGIQAELAEVNAEIAEVKEELQVISENIEENVEVVEEVLENTEELQDTIEAVEAFSKGNFNPVAAMYMQNKGEALNAKLFGVPRATPGFESWSDSASALHELRSSCEGWKDTIKGWKDAIVKFFKKIWGYVAGFFRRFFTALGRYTAKAKKLETKLDSSDTEIKTEIKSPGAYAFVKEIKADSPNSAASGIVKGCKTITGGLSTVTANANDVIGKATVVKDGIVTLLTNGLPGKVENKTVGKEKIVTTKFGPIQVVGQYPNEGIDKSGDVEATLKAGIAYIKGCKLSIKSVDYTAPKTLTPENRTQLLARVKAVVSALETLEAERKDSTWSDGNRDAVVSKIQKLGDNASEAEAKSADYTSKLFQAGWTKFASFATVGNNAVLKVCGYTLDYAAASIK